MTGSGRLPKLAVMAEGTTDIRELDRRAMSVTARLVAGLAPARLASPSPCAGWTLGDLLAHIVGQYHGFALAASGEPTSLEAFRPRPVGDDPAGAYAEAAGLVSEAFGGDGVLGRSFWLPEIRDGGPFPAPTAIGFHFVDEVVHAWDLAKAASATASFDDEVLAVALRMSARIPNDPATRGEGFAFALGREPAPGAPVLDRIVTLLGRDPGWAPGR